MKNKEIEKEKFKLGLLTISLGLIVLFLGAFTGWLAFVSFGLAWGIVAFIITCLVAYFLARTGVILGVEGTIHLQRTGELK